MRDGGTPTAHARRSHWPSSRSGGYVDSTTNEDSILIRNDLVFGIGSEQSPTV
jgi:hypothetical protein